MEKRELARVFEVSTGFGDRHPCFFSSCCTSDTFGNLGQVTVSLSLDFII